jgi:hypothetical protein
MNFQPTTFPGNINNYSSVYYLLRSLSRRRLLRGPQHLSTRRQFSHFTSPRTTTTTPFQLSCAITLRCSLNCAPRVRGANSPSVDVWTRRDNTAARVSSIRPAIDIFSINAVSTLGRSNLRSTLAWFSFGRSTTCRQNSTIYFFNPFRFLRSSHALAAGPGTSPPA